MQEFPQGKGGKGLPRGVWSLHPWKNSKEFLDVEGIQVGIGHSLESVTLESFSSLWNSGILFPYAESGMLGQL